MSRQVGRQAGRNAGIPWFLTFRIWKKSKYAFQKYIKLYTPNDIHINVLRKRQVNLVIGINTMYTIYISFTPKQVINNVSSYITKSKTIVLK